MNSNHKTVRIAVLLGDPSGVGPEMMVRMLADRKRYADEWGDAAFLLIGDPLALADGERVCATSLNPRHVDSMSAPLKVGELAFFPLETGLTTQNRKRGQSTIESGRATLAAFDAATDAAKRGDVDGICFAPMNKHSLRIAGMVAEDEMRHMQANLGVKTFVCEFNVTQGLWTSRVTSHIPLKDVSAHLTEAGICDAVHIIDRSLRAAGNPAPKIGVCGLNPHAGDGGSIGREEIDLIAPSVEKVKALGIHVFGPLPADTIFVAARKGAFDGIVTMYHDQGQIAMKLMGFDNGITVLGGLPVPVTTCASGSAFDIAGKGIANIGGLVHAMKTCIAMGRHPHG